VCAEQLIGGLSGNLDLFTLWQLVQTSYHKKVGYQSDCLSSRRLHTENISVVTPAKEVLSRTQISRE